MLRTCFVIQRFDNGPYDRRYSETFAPAIEAGGAKPVRADEVLGTRPVIEKIESGLRESTIAFAEISENNPNVFLELGYALALNTPTVIVCDRSKRAQLPFDVSHRPILFYGTESQSDFEKIGDQISDNIRVAVQEFETRKSAFARTDTQIRTKEIDDLKDVCLLEFLDADLRSPDGTAIWNIQRKLVGPYISERMVTLATASLLDDGFLEKFDGYDQDNHESYVGFRITEMGRKHILRSYSALKRQEEERLKALDDTVPF